MKRKLAHTRVEFFSRMILTLMLLLSFGSVASGSTRSISVTETGVLPSSVSVTVGDTVRWDNECLSTIQVQCGPGYSGTAMPEGVNAFELIILSTSHGDKKITTAGTYSYKILREGQQLFGEVIAVAPLPVELTDFVATTIKNEVILDWSTSGEVNNERFEIQRVRIGRKMESSSGLLFETIGSLQGIGNSNNIHNYSFADKNLESGSYLYRLKQYDYNGNYMYHMLSTEVQIGVPGKFKVSQNYPNPFNPETSVSLDVPYSGYLKVELYDVSGKVVSRIADGFVSAGYQSIRISGSSLNSGYYFCRFEYSNDQEKVTETKKLLLLK
jgi:hypothetical protein